MSIDTTQYYKLSTRQLGDGFALESTDPGGRPLMTRWADEAGQLWRLTPRGAYYQLSSLYNGEAYGLEGAAPPATAPTTWRSRGSRASSGSSSPNPTGGTA